MEIDIQALRIEIFQAVDNVLAKYMREDTAIMQTSIVLTRSLDTPWKYIWPNKEVEDYKTGTEYKITGATGYAQVRVGWSQRYAWGKLRGRIIIFGMSERQKSGLIDLYPWIEFVEADNGSYVAPIPDPIAPRSMLKDGDPVPLEVAGKTIRRTDECFGSVKAGASLRLVLERVDEEEMVRHAFWVAQLRGRVS